MSDGPLEHDEMVAILVEIARESGNAAARIAAIKQLMAMGEGKEDDAGGRMAGALRGRHSERGQLMRERVHDGTRSSREWSFIAVSPTPGVPLCMESGTFLLAGPCHWDAR